MDLGMYDFFLSSDFKKATDVQEAATGLPLGNLVETDAPTAPVPTWFGK